MVMLLVRTGKCNEASASLNYTLGSATKHLAGADPFGCYHLLRPLRVEGQVVSLLPSVRKTMSTVVLQLPRPSLEDDMKEKKEVLLEERGYPLSFVITAENIDYSNFLDRVLLSARILQLNEKEWYFVEEDEGPFSPRNELEALHTVESLIRQLKEVSPEETRKVLEKLHATVVSRLDSLGAAEVLKESAYICSGESETALSNWAADHGVKSKLQLGVFEGTGRGAAAATSIKIGDIVLEIPEELIICDNSALHSDLGSVLSGMGLSGETVAMLWTMREIHIKNSKFAAYFAALPENFNTGLSLGFKGLQALQGTLLLQEILQAKEHLRFQYDSLFPELSTHHPDLFPEDRFTWDHFLWTAELWYSYGIKVLFPDGGLKTCLVPMASLLNHSVYPHITHYSRVNPATRTLQLSAVRSCQAGSQCFLSYGPLSNQELLLFYGFILKENPYDTIPMEFDECSSLDLYGLGPSHMVRGTWLSPTNSRDFGLPTRLMAALRILCLDECGLTTFQGNPRRTMVDAEVEKGALGSLLQTLEALLEEIGESSGPVDDSDYEGWDVVIALDFLKSQRRLIESVRASCMKLMSLQPENLDQ